MSENEATMQPAMNEEPSQGEKTPEETKKILEERMADYKERAMNALEAMREGKGRLRLEKPIHVGENEIQELVYDFTELNGFEYTNAMDDAPASNQPLRITYRQGLALFATAAAKQTDNIDAREIIENIGMSDAVEGVELAISFFTASTRAGRMRISKK